MYHQLYVHLSNAPHQPSIIITYRTVQGMPPGIRGPCWWPPLPLLSTGMSAAPESRSRGRTQNMRAVAQSAHLVNVLDEGTPRVAAVCAALLGLSRHKANAAVLVPLKCQRYQQQHKCDQKYSNRALDFALATAEGLASEGLLTPSNKRVKQNMQHRLRVAPPVLYGCTYMVRP